MHNESFKKAVIQAALQDEPHEVVQAVLRCLARARPDPSICDEHLIPSAKKIVTNYAKSVPGSYILPPHFRQAEDDMTFPTRDFKVIVGYQQFVIPARSILDREGEPNVFQKITQNEIHFNKRSAKLFESIFSLLNGKRLVDLLGTVDFKALRSEVLAYGFTHMLSPEVETNVVDLTILKPRTLGNCMRPEIGYQNESGWFNPDSDAVETIFLVDFGNAKVVPTKLEFEVLPVDGSWDVFRTMDFGMTDDKIVVFDPDECLITLYPGTGRTSGKYTITVDEFPEQPCSFAIFRFTHLPGQFRHFKISSITMFGMYVISL